MTKQAVTQIVPYTVQSERALDVETHWKKIKARSRTRDTAEDGMLTFMCKSPAYKSMTYEQMLEYVRALP
jgi:hypothetical protein